MIVGGIANVGPWTAVGLAEHMVERVVATREAGNADAARMPDVARMEARSAGIREEHVHLPGLIFSINGEAVAAHARDPAYAELMRAAEVIHADGMSTVWASRLFYGRAGAPERVASTDFIWPAATACARAGVSFYFLGGRPGVAEAAAAAVRERVPELSIVGTHHGYFSESEEAGVVEAIRAAQPDVVWVGLGRPRQEAFCVRHRAALAGASWLKSCGGLFDFLSGRSSRAPRAMQRLGLEWLYRGLREPGRLGRRYLLTNGPAAWYLLTRTGERAKSGS